MHVTVEEHDGKKTLNTPGGDELLKRFGGSGGSLPFHAFVDAEGALLINSMRPGKGGKPENIGYPGEPFEIDWFLHMLDQAAPRMTAPEKAALEKWLRSQKK